MCASQPGWDPEEGDSWFNGVVPQCLNLPKGLAGQTTNKKQPAILFQQVCVLLIQEELRSNKEEKKAETPLEVLAYPLERFKAVVHCLNFSPVIPL